MSMLGLSEDHEKFPWREEPRLKMIVTLTQATEKAFLLRLHKQLALKDGFFSAGRVEFLVFVSENIAKLLNSRIKLRDKTLFFNNFYSIFYDVKYFDKFTWDSFYPTPRFQTKVLVVNRGKTCFTRLLFFRGGKTISTPISSH